MPSPKFYFQVSKHLADLVNAYADSTILLLYPEGKTDKVKAIWANKNTDTLITKQIGQVNSNIEVHTFGIDEIADFIHFEIQDELLSFKKKFFHESPLNNMCSITVRFEQPRVQTKKVL